MPRRPLAHSTTPRRRASRVASRMIETESAKLSVSDRSPEEKRHLILAHAAQRTARDPMQILSMWAGVLALFIVIVGAWGYATIPGIVQTASQPLPDQFTGVVSTVFDQFKINASTTTPTQTINEATDRIHTLRSQIDEQQAVIDALREQFTASSTSVRSDLLMGRASSTSPNTISTSTTSPSTH